MLVAWISHNRRLLIGLGLNILSAPLVMALVEYYLQFTEWGQRDLIRSLYGERSVLSIIARVTALVLAVAIAVAWQWKPKLAAAAQITVAVSFFIALLGGRYSRGSWAEASGGTLSRTDVLAVGGIIAMFALIVMGAVWAVRTLRVGGEE